MCERFIKTRKLNLVKIIYEKIEISTALDVVADWESKAVIFFIIVRCRNWCSEELPDAKMAIWSNKKKNKVNIVEDVLIFCFQRMALDIVSVYSPHLPYEPVKSAKSVQFNQILAVHLFSSDLNVFQMWHFH